MKLRIRIPYTVEQIHATPYEYDRPYDQTRRGMMWQARIDYFDAWARVFGVLSVIAALVTVVMIVLVVTR